METKTCIKCGEEKLLDGDHCTSNFRRMPRGHFRGTCRACEKTYRISQNNERKKYVRDYFEEHPCIDCGEDDIRVLQFDHVRDKKLANVSAIVRKGRSIVNIQREIDKCEVRCANCHIKRTFDVLNWSK